MLNILELHIEVFDCHQSFNLEHPTQIPDVTIFIVMLTHRGNAYGAVSGIDVQNR